MSKHVYVDLGASDMPMKFWKLAIIAFLLGVFVGSICAFSQAFGFSTQIVVS